MCFISFQQGPSYYGYGPGVNAANLTSNDIAKANARLEPQRQRRIEDGLLKATQGDAKTNTASKSARGDGVNEGDGAVSVSKYSSWTGKELRKAIVDRRIKSKKRVAKM